MYEARKELNEYCITHCILHLQYSIRVWCPLCSAHEGKGEVAGLGVMVLLLVVEGCAGLTN